MIKLSKIPQIIFASVLALAMWTFISVNTSAFVIEDEFDYFQYILAYAISLGTWAVISFKFNLMPRVKQGIGIGLFALTPFFCMHISMILSGSAEFLMKIYFINVLLYFAVMAAIFTVTQSMRWSAVITVVLSYIFNLANFVVNYLRGTPLSPGDFLAVQTAANVAENYEFEMQYQIVIVTVLLVFLISLICVFGYGFPFKAWKKRLIAFGCGAVMCAAAVIPISKIDISMVSMDDFDQYHANNTHGVLYSFYVNLCRMKIEKPDGYSKEEMQQMLKDTAAETFSPPEDKPNIVVIMNESFADLGVLGNLETDKDYMPFFREIKNNAVKGELLVSPFGGNTCNTEFEFFTGMSMGLLPSGTEPYLQYINHDCPESLCRHLTELGYKNIALHPFYARGWNREKVYKYLGFDEFISIENLEEYLNPGELKYVRNYVSDRTSYSAVMNALEKKNPEERMFIFDVTIQNHGGYTYQDPKLMEDIKIKNLAGSYPAAEQYLSLIRESDIAFEDFVYRLKSWKEPVLLVMFGDHQPAVEQEFYEELLGGELEQLPPEDIQKRYKVPFLIWANYDIEERTDLKTSPCFLSNYMLEAAGLPKSKVGVILDGIKQEIPQINERGYFNADGELKSIDDDDLPMLSQYVKLEYHIMTQKPDELTEQLK